MTAKTTRATPAGPGEDDRGLEENNGGMDAPTSTASHRHSRMSAIVSDFSFMWFTLSMNTGILSILMHQLPYQFQGLGILSTIMFVFNLILFTLFFAVLIARIIWFRQAIVDSCKSNLVELAMVGAVPIAFFTLVAQIGITASAAEWGQRPWFLVAYVMWWIGTAVMMVIAVAVFAVVAECAVADISQLSPVLVLPFVGTTTDAVVGGIIVLYSDGVDARLAIPVIIVAYLLAGLGFFVGLVITTCYFARLLNHGTPPPAQAPSLFLLVGPPGQTAAAILVLGSASKQFFGQYGRGSFFTDQSGTIVSTSCVLLALLLLGLAVFFILISILFILRITFKRQLSYSLIWWGTIFPVATVNTAFISLAEVMDSPTFRVLATIFLLVLLVDYFINMGFTLYQIYQGKLLSGKKSWQLANGNRAKLS